MPKCFYPRSIQLLDPWNKMTGEYMSHANVPCGKCEQCIKRRRMEWSFRLENELRHSKTGYMVTLTYSPQEVPYDKYGNKILKKDDVVKFMKRLRHAHERNKVTTRDHYYHRLNNKDKIKYYICGEYGEEKGRPHYHMIIFNGSQQIIEQTWNKGTCHFKPATAETIAYTTKYLDKWRDKKQDWKKPKEFNIQSEGIGKRFCEQNKEWYRNNLDVNYVVNSKGIKIPMPRYYRMKMLTDNHILLQRSIIVHSIEDKKNEEIAKWGLDKYNEKQLMKMHYIKTVFKKQTVKRTM